MKKSARISLLIIGLLFFVMTSLRILKSGITYWNEYGGMYWDYSFKENIHNGSLSAVTYGPKNNTGYSFLYQIIEIDPLKTYCLDLWVNNVSMRTAGGRFGFREDSDFYPSSFKAATDLDNNGENDEDYGEKYVSDNSGWKNLVITNSPDTNTRNWVKVGLRVNYHKGSTSLYAYFDDIKFYSLDNPDVNLILNGDFECDWNYPSIPGVKDDYKIYAYPKIFTPRGYDRLCSINIKISKINSIVRVELLSLNGVVKKVFYSSTLDSLNTSILWDGTDNRGIILPMGIYVLKMKVIEYENNIPKEKEFKSLVVLGNNLR